MICWPGDEMHEGLRRWLAGVRTEHVPAEERCVNEGAEGCTQRAADNGWCGPCWASIVPATDGELIEN